MPSATFDYIVIGAGSSGAAWRRGWARRPTRTTCVLEAGGQDTHPFIHIPSFVAAAIGREANQLAVRDRAAAGHGRARRSRCRAARCSADRARSTGWSISAATRPITTTGPMRARRAGPTPKCCPISPAPRTTRISPRACSTAHGGPINVKHVEGPNALNYAFMDALGALQFPAMPGLQRAEPEGYGRRQGLMRDGRRESTAMNMLRPALARGNVHVQTDAQVAADRGRERPRHRRRADRRPRDQGAAAR